MAAMQNKLKAVEVEGNIEGSLIWCFSDRK